MGRSRRARRGRRPKRDRAAKSRRATHRRPGHSDHQRERPARYEIRTDRVVAGVVFALFGTAFLLDDLGVWRFDLVLIWPIALIAIGVAVLLGRARREEVEETRRAQIAVAEERVRIARDLHDIVAHGVSLMTIQIAAARRVLRTKPDAAEEALRHAEEAGRRSLTELRDLVSVLRSADDSLGAVDAEGRPPRPRERQGASAGTPRSSTGPGGSAPGSSRDHEPAGGGGDDRDAPLSPLPGFADIEALVERFRSAGLDVIYVPLLTVSHDHGPRLGLAAYRIVQEALTNVLRHAGPDTPTRVEIVDDGADLTVTVTDDGTDNPPPPVASGQHGLVGMRERAAAAGGTLSAGPRHDARGWRVEAVLPLNGGR